MMNFEAHNMKYSHSLNFLSTTLFPVCKWSVNSLLDKKERQHTPADCLEQTRPVYSLCYADHAVCVTLPLKTKERSCKVSYTLANKLASYNAWTVSNIPVLSLQALSKPNGLRRPNGWWNRASSRLRNHHVEMSIETWSQFCQSHVVHTDSEIRITHWD